MQNEAEYMIGMDEDGHFFAYHLWYDRAEIRKLLNDDVLYNDMVSNSMESWDDLDEIMNFETTRPTHFIKRLKSWLYEAVIQRGTAEIVMLKQHRPPSLPPRKPKVTRIREGLDLPRTPPKPPKK